MLSGDRTIELFSAIMSDDLETTRGMISAATINAADGLGVTPLLLAVRSEAVKVTEFLLAHPHINLVNQGTGVFEEALRYYFMSVQVFSDACELNCILTLLTFHQSIDFSQPAIKKLLENNAGPLSELIQLIASLRDKCFNNNYFEYVLKQIKSKHQIAELFITFDRPESVKYWLYQAAIQVLSTVRTTGPEPTLVIPGAEEKAEFLAALGAVVLFYQEDIPGLIITRNQAHDACMLLCGIYLRTNVNLISEYLFIAKQINGNVPVNTISQKFIDAYTSHYPEDYQAKTITAENKFSHKAAFMFNLKEAMAVESVHARAYLENIITNKKDMLSIIAEAVLQDSFGHNPDATVIKALKLLYGQDQDINFGQSAQLFEILAASAINTTSKFYYNFMRLIAYANIIRENPRADTIEQALAIFQVMLVYYSDDYELEYHLEIFATLIELLKKHSSAENDIAIFKMMMEYALALLRMNNHQGPAKLSEVNMKKLFNVIFDSVQKSNLLNDIQNWPILISYTNEFLRTSAHCSEMINYFVQGYDGLRISSALTEIANISLLRHLVSMYRLYMFDLDRDSTQLAIFNLQKLISSYNEDSQYLIHLITEFHLRAAELIIEQETAPLPVRAVEHAVQALHFAVYPEHGLAISRIAALLNPHLNSNQDETLMKLISRAQQALTPASDESLANLIADNYFPALIKLTYKHIQEKNARRALYLSARLSVELLINKDQLIKLYPGLTEDTLATLKKDIYHYYNSFAADSKYTGLVEWYHQFIKLMTKLSVNNKSSAQDLDIDAIMYGNSRYVSAIRDSVKYGMTQSLIKNASYYHSKATVFAALRQDWEDKIILNQSSITIEMSFWNKSPAKASISVDEVKQDNSLRN
jgi:hypothetical protein